MTVQPRWPDGGSHIRWPSARATSRASAIRARTPSGRDGLTGRRCQCRFQGACEPAAEILDLVAGRKINGLRRQAAELVVGQDIRRAGAQCQPP